MQAKSDDFRVMPGVRPASASAVTRKARSTDSLPGQATRPASASKTASVTVASPSGKTERPTSAPLGRNISKAKAAN